MRLFRYEMGRTVCGVRASSSARAGDAPRGTRGANRRASEERFGGSARKGAFAAGAAKAAEASAARRDRCGLAAAAAHAHGPSRSRACEAVSGKAELVACSAKLVACYHLLQRGAARRGDGVGRSGERTEVESVLQHAPGAARGTAAEAPLSTPHKSSRRAPGVRCAFSQECCSTRTQMCMHARRACSRGGPTRGRAAQLWPRACTRASHTALLRRGVCTRARARAWPRPVCRPPQDVGCHARSRTRSALAPRSLASNARMSGRARPTDRPTDRPTNRPTCRRPTRPAPAPARPPARLPALSPHTRGRAHRKRAGTRTEHARARVQHTREGGCTLPVALHLRRRVERLWIFLRNNREIRKLSRPPRPRKGCYDQSARRSYMRARTGAPVTL